MILVDDEIDEWFSVELSFLRFLFVEVRVISIIIPIQINLKWNMRALFYFFD